MTSEAAVRSPEPTRLDRSRLAAVVSAIAALHVIGWSLYLSQSHRLSSAASFTGAGTLAYVLGIRHAFDADHIAAIDDTTRLMVARGRRPVGVGFFFAVGHSSVVLLLAVVTALGSAHLTSGGFGRLRDVGGQLSVLVAVGFLLLVAVLNTLVLRGLVGLWRQYRAGRLCEDDVDILLLNRGLVNRVIGPRAAARIQSSWHMAPVGFLFGLGLETASEVTLLGLSASAASGGQLPILAVLSLPLLFAAGMTMFDTADSLLMARAYGWAQGKPGRRLYYNVATTGVTVGIGLFVAFVYLTGFITEQLSDSARADWPISWLSAAGSLSEHFELLGYVIAGIFVVSWLTAAALWRLRYRHR